MRPGAACLLSLALSVFGTSVSSVAFAQSGSAPPTTPAPGTHELASDPVVGTWLLTSVKTRLLKVTKTEQGYSPSATTIEPYGPSPLGVLILERSGRFTSIIAGRIAEHFDSGTDNDVPAELEASSGTYSLHGLPPIIDLHFQVNKNAKLDDWWAGIVGKKADELTLQRLQPPAANNGGPVTGTKETTSTLLVYKKTE
jgi:hypothetical protein